MVAGASAAQARFDPAALLIAWDTARASGLNNPAAAERLESARPSVPALAGDLRLACSRISRRARLLPQLNEIKCGCTQSMGSCWSGRVKCVLWRPMHRYTTARCDRFEIGCQISLGAKASRWKRHPRQESS